MNERIASLTATHQTVYALPQPSAEGWLQADLSALRRGVSEALGTPIRLPQNAGGYPRDEGAAKDRLRALLTHQGLPVLRDGLEYGPFVMQYVDYDAHPSLAVFVGELRTLLRVGDG